MTDIAGTLLPKGIVYALVAIDAAPPERRTPGDRDGLVHLYHLMVQAPAERERLAAEVEQVTGILVDITDWEGRPWTL